MEIKFWDKVKCEYNVYNDYYLNEYLNVYEEDITDYYGSTFELRKGIEPHFYVNGKRVA